MIPSATQLWSEMLCYLAQPALRTLGFAVFVGLALSVARVRDGAIRLAAWTAVLYAALAMPFLAWVAPAVR